MKTRPRTKFAMQVKSRRCSKCGAKLNSLVTRCKRCHEKQNRPKK
jgi:ribosomal protein L40E